MKIRLFAIALLVLGGSAVFVTASAAAPCLPDGTCVPDVPVDPCTSVNVIDPCSPAAPDLPELPEMPALPGPELLPPVPHDAPTGPAAAEPTAEPLPGDVPAAPTDGAVPESVVTGEGDSRAGPADAPGGGSRSGPATVGTPASFNRPAAVAKAARSFVLLFVLAALVAGWLVVQRWLDQHDPKLVAAPIHSDDEMVTFT